MSLRLRLTILSGLITGGSVLLFATAFYVILQTNLLREVDQQLRDRADIVTATLTTGVMDINEETRTLPATPFVEFATPEIYVELITPDGQIRAASDNLDNDRLPTTITLLETARSDQIVLNNVHTDRGDLLRMRITTIQTGPYTGDVLVVAESLVPTQRILTQTRALLLLCGILAFVLAVSGTAFVTERSLAPINRLIRTAAAVATTGDYHKRVPVSQRNDEIGQLARTLNELIATVERTIGQQRQFIADTSHELRSPLTVILANLNLLRRSLEQDERDLSISEATAEAQRMRRLVNDLLMLARADAAQMIAQVPVQLDQLVTETVATVARQTDSHTIRAQVEEAITVQGDDERLTQLLRNLLENAINHTPLDTQIDVRLRRADTVAQISVSDDGPGIAAEHLPHIWNRFYRADKARARTMGGSGLGLPIVKYIAEAHGGYVNVVSDAGKGTTFTIILPLTEQTQTEIEEVSTIGDQA
ncbi:MAG: ATP-binding protein [Chloroflexota bacterium]